MLCVKRRNPPTSVLPTQAQSNPAMSTSGHQSASFLDHHENPSTSYISSSTPSCLSFGPGETSLAQQPTQWPVQATSNLAIFQFILSVPTHCPLLLGLEPQIEYNTSEFHNSAPVFDTVKEKITKNCILTQKILLGRLLLGTPNLYHFHFHIIEFKI